MITAAVFGRIKNGRAYANESCLNHITKSGMNPKLIVGERANDTLQKCDCLILCGEGDIDPTLYGQLPIEQSRSDRALDLAELEYIHAFYDAKKPILGISRGIQSINTAFGGTLIQDIPSMLGLSHASCGGKECEHEIKISKTSRLYKALGLRAVVNSKHHQCVHTTGRGLYVAAASHDGIIEAIESNDRLILGIQWHPEMMSGNAVFDHFVNEYVK